MAPSCGLDEAGLRSQLERYRRVGEGARLVERSPRRLVVELGELVDETLIREAVDIERACCPFLEIDWPQRRRLMISVSRSADEPALDVIASALGLATRDRGWSGIQWSGMRADRTGPT